MGRSFKDALNDIEATVKVEPVPIVTGLEAISVLAEKATFAEAEKIWPILEASLNPAVGFGLAAIQIGIPKKVAVIFYNGKKYRLLNTEIVEKQNEVVIYNEGCLSLPNKTMNTLRCVDIVIQDDVMGKVALSGHTDGLLPIIFQHEIDHFEGKSIYDYKLKPIKNTTKIGRNDPCPCGSGKKYKRCCLV